MKNKKPEKMFRPNEKLSQSIKSALKNTLKQRTSRRITENK